MRVRLGKGSFLLKFTPIPNTFQPQPVMTLLGSPLLEEPEDQEQDPILGSIPGMKVDEEA